MDLVPSPPPPPGREGSERAVLPGMTPPFLVTPRASQPDLGTGKPGDVTSHKQTRNQCKRLLSLQCCGTGTVWLEPVWRSGSQLRFHLRWYRRISEWYALRSFQTSNIDKRLIKNKYFKSVLRSRNYLFLAPAPTLTIISAPAPAPATAIYWHFKLF